MLNEPADHHFVPIFYLNAWCGNDGRLERYSRPYNNIVTDRCPPKSTGFERDLYSLKGTSPTRKQLVEKRFMHAVDTRAAKVFSALRKGQRELSVTERSDAARFIMSLRTRTPEALERLRRYGLPEIMATLEAHPEQHQAFTAAAGSTDLSEWLRSTMPELVENVGVLGLQKLVDNSNVGSRLVNMTWRMYGVQNANTDLLTSDRPCLVAPSTDGIRRLIALPVAPRLLLVISDNLAALDRTNTMTPNQLVKAVNRDIVAHASRYVYGTGKHHLLLVQKRLRRQAARTQERAFSK